MELSSTTIALVLLALMGISCVTMLRTTQETYSQHDAYLDSAGRPAVLVCHYNYASPPPPLVLPTRPDPTPILPTSKPGMVQLYVTTPPMTQYISNKTQAMQNARMAYVDGTGVLSTGQPLGSLAVPPTPLPTLPGSAITPSLLDILPNNTLTPTATPSPIPSITTTPAPVPTLPASSTNTSPSPSTSA